MARRIHNTLKFAQNSRFSTAWDQLSSTVPRKGDKVVVAMSGGVDSSVAALTLAHEDYDLSAVYMRNWDARDEYASDSGCEWQRDWHDVQSVCNRLGLPCGLVDLSNQYWTHVFEPALQGFEEGLTPNPDVFCNREIKFGRLMEKVVSGSKHWLATGHYANISWTKDNRPRLMRARDRTKDQTFFLSSISESSLKKTLFPLGALLKSDVREMAHKANLPTAYRSESMGLCFIGEKRRFSQFLSQYLSPRPGDIVDLAGKVVAKHQGLWEYTIGQGAKIPGMKDRMFVASKDIASNQLLVVPGTDHPALFCRSIAVTDWRWIWPDFRPVAISQVTVQIRHRMFEVLCTIEQRSPGNIIITFSQPEKAVAPGQVAAIWDKDWCLGCGVISETWS